MPSPVVSPYGRIIAWSWVPEEARQRRLEGRRVAIAGGRAFTFAYAETTELLLAAGCEPVVFDPTSDEQLPAGTQGLYLGGGFPEVHAAELSGNEPLRHQLREAVRGGLPTVAECAGLLYLCRSVDGAAMVGAVPADAAMGPRLTLAYRTATAPRSNLLGRPGETVTGHEFHRTRLLVPPSSPAWSFGDGLTDGVATETLHASYLHTHWAGHPRLAARFVDAVRAANPVAAPTMGVSRLAGARTSTTDITDPLRHHGDVEATAGLLDFAVNVYDGPRPDWLEEALAGADLGRYPDPTVATEAIAARHGRTTSEVLPTAGAAEAFGLLARLRPWRRPVVVHPQFTEPDVALTTAGHPPEHLLLAAADGFRLDASRLPADADLVVIGNPTNPTGVRHPAHVIRSLLAPGRLVVVDEAFLDDGVGSLATGELAGLVVVRSLTKLWSIPGVRAGYLLAEPAVVQALTALQTPWSVSAAAAAALVACSSEDASEEALRRVGRIHADREFLLAGMAKLGITYVTGSTAPFVLAQPGPGVHAALRDVGYAVRRADTFPGLDESWVRIAVRDRGVTTRLLDALECIHQARGSRWESGTVALL
jgi:cobyrinic acid a,c-diamide synthase